MKMTFLLFCVIILKMIHGSSVPRLLGGGTVIVIFPLRQRGHGLGGAVVAGEKISFWFRLDNYQLCSASSNTCNKLQCLRVKSSTVVHVRVHYGQRGTGSTLCTWTSGGRAIGI